MGRDVLVESFEEGESVARFLGRAGEGGLGAEDAALRANVAVCGMQAFLKMLVCGATPPPPQPTNQIAPAPRFCPKPKPRAHTNIFDLSTLS